LQKNDTLEEAVKGMALYLNEALAQKNWFL
jgi:hypothetical protein